MTRRKFIEWFIPTLGLIVMCGAILLYYIIGNMINYNLIPDDTYVTNTLVDNDNTMKVQNEVEAKVIKPFTSNEVTISKYYYQASDEEARQQQSLIKYENIYMPNTGVLYSSDTEFEIVSVLDGKVTSMKEDEILGNIIEIEHANGLITIYQSVKDVKVKTGDVVKQGDVIAMSGSNKLENEKENCLHFETYKEGSLINPEEFYNLSISN
ncbi:MAG: M23 family metallopeptidase [Bacilli bacterium]|nr:M23 family metallopeptidase [Bacilli bacterium]